MSESWKIENDLCRCCHSEGTHKKLGDPCLEGEEEIYSEMIHDTLDIDIKPVSGPLGSVTYTICEVCIMRLQDAWSFKQQVLQCERRFLDLYTRNVIKMEPDNVIVIDVKKETADSDNEGFKEERIEDDSGEDFPMTYDDGEIKSDDSMEVQLELRKTKPKPKPKAKPKAAPKTAKPRAQTKKVARPSTAKDAAMTESEQSEQKEKKGDDELQNGMRYTIRESEGTKQYVCSLCGSKFEKLQYFSQHYKHVHLKLRPKLRSCYMCPVKVSGYMRTKHMEEVHGVPRPECLACGKKFAFPYQVTQHQKAFHMDEKAYSCPGCDMRFSLPSELTKHAVKHSSVRPYKCDYCEKAFRWKKNLGTHVMMHLDDRRHVCVVCKEAFVQSSSLKYHLTKKHPELV